MIRTAREVNDSKPQWVLEQVRKQADRFKNPVIGCLGLAFKADVDDLRESPALDIVRTLVKDDIGQVLVCEPNLKQHPEFSLLTLDELIKRADILLLLVDHKPFKKLTAKGLKDKILIDTRGIVS